MPSLLETITKAAGDAEEIPTPSKYPIIVNSDEIFRRLEPENEDSGNTFLIKRVRGWQISQTDTEIIDSGNKFSKKLKRKLKNPGSFHKDEFLSLITSFLQNLKEKIKISIVPSNLTGEEYTCGLIEKLGFMISKEVTGLISEASILLEMWKLLETLISQRILSRSSHANLVENLIEKKRCALLCLYIKKVPDLHPSDFFAILSFFLSSETLESSEIIRKEWEEQALLAIEKSTTKNLPDKRSRSLKNAAVLLMIAHDGFTTSELCLHFLFGSSNFDGLALSSAIARLNGVEIMKLMRYLVKWMKKYERFPEASPCSPEKASAMGLELCKWVPPVDLIARYLGLVFDEQFAVLVLNSEFHEELKGVEEVVRGMVLEAEVCSSVAGVIEHVRLSGIGGY